MSGPLSNPFMFKSSAAGAAAMYSHQINKSARFTGSGTMSRTAGTPTNVDKFTISCWVKRGILSTATNFVFGYEDNLNYQKLAFNSSDKLELHEQRGAGDSNGLRTVDQVFRDPAAWMHVVWVYDSGNATEADREIFYVNGTRLSDVEGWDGGYPTQNRDSVFNKSGATQHIGSASSYYGSYFQGYMAEVVFNDGQAYAASDYGETNNGVWRPKDPSGLTFGNNGFYLNFANASDMGNDVSGNDNDFSESGVDTHDQMLDTPTFNSSSNGGSFCTLNPLAKGSNATLSEGNLRASGNSSDGSYVPSTMAFKTGKWYCEFLCIDKLEGWPYVSICDYQNTELLTSVGQVFAIRYQADDDLEENSSDNTKSFGSITLDATGLTTYDDGDIIGTYIDCDNKKLWFTKNGSYFNSGDPSAGTNPQATWTGTPTIAFMGATYQNWDYIMNFGADGTFAGEKTAQGNADGNGYGNFYYAPDTGFLAMCTANLPIVDEVDPAQTSDNYPQKLFGATIWTGDGNTSRAITGVEFQPDWLWFKSRGSAFSHRIYDTSRGITSTGGKRLFSNTTAVETNQTSGQDISAVGSDGFTLGASSNLYTNDTNDGGLHVAWAWRANGGTTSTNSNGGTDSTVQVDPSGHFSIVLGTGNNDSWGNAQTFGHGLSAAPTVIIGKQRADNADEWQVFFNNYGNTSIGGSNAASNSLVLNSTDDLYTNQSYKGWGGVMPTSTVFTLDGNNLVGNTHTFVCYCFADCEGYIKSGTFKGNGSTDGTFIYTGFKPAFILMKRINRNGDYWYLFDTTRNPFNGPGMKMLNADDTIVESSHGTSNVIDILSNGWKMRTSGSGLNGSGGEWVFLAMADNSLKYATAR
jgi:hypothetical protein